MPVTLRSLVDPNQVSLTPIGSTPEEDAARAQSAYENEMGQYTTLGRANIRGQHQVPAMLANAAGQLTEPFAPQFSQDVFDFARGQQEIAQNYSSPSDITDYRNVKGLSDAGNFVTNMVGENLAQIPLTLLGGGMANLGLRGVAMPMLAKNMLGASAASYPLVMGENVSELRADPVAMANTTPGQRLMNTAGAAALQAPLDAVGDALLMGRAMGGGKALTNVFKDGVRKSSKDALSHVAKAVPEAALTEGLPEAGQEYIKQQMLSNVNPQRDTSKDEHDLANSFFAGWAAGGPMSAVGRGADVAWAQGRGATEAIRGLINDKILPKSLTSSDDKSVLEWDGRDNDQRNGWAKDIADRVMNSDAAEYMKRGAQEFYERASKGASDAWTSMSDALKRNDAYNRASDSVDRFASSVKGANKEFFNEESTADQITGAMAVGKKATPVAAPKGADKNIYNVFAWYLDPNIYNADMGGGTDKAYTLYNAVKQMIKNGHGELSNADLTQLEHNFRGHKNVAQVISDVTDEMVRQGMLDHDPKWMDLFKAAHDEQHNNLSARAEIVRRYSPQGRTLTDIEAREIARQLSNGFSTYSQMSEKKRGAFDTAVAAVFGKNAKKTDVLEAFRPITETSLHSEEQAEEIGDVVEDKPQFFGSAEERQRKNAAAGKELTVQDHGGMWNLGLKDEKARAEITERFKAKIGALRQQGATVTQLKPLEYAERAGIDPIKIANSLNVRLSGKDDVARRLDAMKQLKNHPARMLMLEKNGQVGLSKEGDERISTDEIKALGEKTHAAQKRFEKQFVPEDKVESVKKALGMTKKGQGGAQRKALSELGFPNAVDIEQTPKGWKVKNNLNHSDMGRFEVHMTDGAVHTISAQEAISHIRGKGRKEVSGTGTALQQFNAVIAQIMTNPDVADVKVRDVWGNELSAEKVTRKPTGAGESEQGKTQSPDERRAAAEKKLQTTLGKFGSRFRLTPDLTIGRAHKAAQPWAGSLNQPSKVEEADDAVGYFEQKIDELVAEKEELENSLAPDEEYSDADEERLSEIEKEIAEAEENLEKARNSLELETSFEEALEGEGDRNEPGQVSLPQQYLNEHGMPLDKPNEKPLDFNDDGTPKHPYGAKDRGPKPTPVNLDGASVRKVRAGLSAENFTAEMNRALKKIEQAREIVSEVQNMRLDMAQDFVYRAAAALKDGNRNASAAHLLMADHNIYQSLVDESDALIYKEMKITPEIERLNKAAGQYQSREDEYQKNKEQTLEDAKGYLPWVEHAPKAGKKKGDKLSADPDRWTHHQHFISLLSVRSKEEIISDGIARKKRMEAMESSAKGMTAKQMHLLNMMADEQELARAELRRREKEKKTPIAKRMSNGYPFTMKDGAKDRLDTQVRREREKREADMKQAAEQVSDNEQTELEQARVDAQENAHTQREAHAAELDKLVEELAKGSEAATRMAKNLSAAFRTLIDAIKNGELNKPELVAALREAWKNFKEAAQHADEARKELVARGTKIVQQAIKEYQEAASKLKAQAEAGIDTKVLVDTAAAYARNTVDKLKELRAQGEAAYQKWRYTASPRSEKPVETSKEYGKRSADDALETAVDAWFEKTGATYRYRPNSQYVSRIKASAKEARTLLDEHNEVLDHSDEKIGPIDGYTTHAFYVKEYGEYFQFAVPSFVSERAGYKLTFEDAINSSVLTLAYDTEDGSLTILGPMPNTTAFDVLRSHLEETGAEEAPYRLKNVSKETMTNLLGEFHARLQMHTGKENVPYVWERKSGASQKAEQTDIKHATYFDESGNRAAADLTEEDLKQARDYVEKVLGPQVKVLLDKELGASASWSRKDGETFIRISTKAINPLSMAHHEAMHEFFERLSETHPQYAAVLAKAANSASVVSQIKNALRADPNFEAIEKAMDKQHERVAYMYQLWAAGKIKVGPNTETVFGKIAQFLRKLFGLVANSDHAAAIMQSFHEGSMSEPNAVARMLANEPVFNSDRIAKARKLSDAVYDTTRELLITAQNELLESGNKGLEKIGRMFSNETGAKDKDIALVSARIQKSNQMLARLNDIIGGLDKKQLAALNEHMQNNTTPTEPDLVKAQERMRKMFDDMHKYATAAGVKLDKVENYYPRSWDSAKISADKANFVKILARDGKMSEQIANETAEAIIRNRGAEPLNEGELRVGYTPYMQAASKRRINFEVSSDLNAFQRKDLVEIVSTYVNHVAHRAEYARRFGNHGEKLRKMIKAAVGDQVGAKEWESASKKAQAVLDALYKELEKKFDRDFDKIAEELSNQGYVHGEVDIKHVAPYLTGDALEKYNAFKAQLRRAQRSIMAMEGTLGYDINPRLRSLQSGIIVYENMRLLTMSLFSQVIDPMGVLVRGGTLNQALQTFKHGWKHTIAGWKGTPLEDSATKLAQKLGVIDVGHFLNNQGQMYSGLFMDKTAKAINDRLFRFNGVEGFSQGTRVGAMLAAIEFIKAHSNDKTAGEHSARWLAELGLKKGDVKLVDGDLDYTDKKIQDAIFRWVDSAVIRPNAAMRPSWASDPHYALFFHMKTFMYAFHKVLLERVAHELKHGNHDPIMNMVITYVPLMIASDIMRGLLTYGGEPPWKRNWGVMDYVADGVQRAGLLGIPQMAMNVVEWGPAELGGPFVEQVARTAKNYEKAYARDKKLDERAESSGKTSDAARAEEFEWLAEGTKKNARLALPAGEIVKRHVYDNAIN